MTPLKRLDGVHQHALITRRHGGVFCQIPQRNQPVGQHGQTRIALPRRQLAAQTARQGGQGLTPGRVVDQFAVTGQRIAQLGVERQARRGFSGSFSKPPGRHGSLKISRRIKSLALRRAEVVMNLLRIDTAQMHIAEVTRHGRGQRPVKTRHVGGLRRCALARLRDRLRQRGGVVILRRQAVAGGGGQQFDGLKGLRAGPFAIEPERRRGWRGLRQ